MRTKKPSWKSVVRESSAKHKTLAAELGLGLSDNSRSARPEYTAIDRLKVPMSCKENVMQCRQCIQCILSMHHVGRRLSFTPTVDYI